MGAVILAELSFGQSVLLEAMKALFVGVLAAGAILIARWVLTGAREKQQVRVDLVRRTSSVNQSFYVQLQSFRRALGLIGNAERMSTEEISAQSAALKASYELWSSDSATLMAELGAYFGERSEVVRHWHQMRDLLVVAYFTLVYPSAESEPNSPQASKEIRKANALKSATGDSEEEFHSGMSVAELKSLPAVMKRFNGVCNGFGPQILKARWVSKWVNWGST